MISRDLLYGLCRGQDPQKICLSLTRRGLSRPLASRLLLVRSAAWVFVVVTGCPITGLTGCLTSQVLLVAPSRVLLVVPSRVLLAVLPRTHFVEVHLRTISVVEPHSGGPIAHLLRTFSYLPGCNCCLHHSNRYRLHLEMRSSPSSHQQTIIESSHRLAKVFGAASTSHFHSQSWHWIWAANK